MENLRQMYADYLALADKLRKEASVFAGLFGMGDDPRKHPCHEAFYQNVDKWVKDFITSQPAPEQVMEAAKFMLEQPRENTGAEGYWFLFACIGFVRSLIPLMNKEDCNTLAERMSQLYTRAEQMPVQRETLKMLLKAGK
ncbi:MAG: hypothetical protein IJO45_06865 [Oscillospiraceae bacterium]|nr:hypothetical protein [Oscillospiraceae bacterium]